MPETPRPSPSPDQGLARNLFLEADPDLDVLAHSTADEPGRDAAGRRRGRGRVVLAAEHRSPDSRHWQDADGFARPNADVGRLLGAAWHWLRQTDAAAGRLLRGLAARPYRPLVTMVVVAGLLVSFSWLVLDVRETSTSRVAADAWPDRNAAMLRYADARIGLLSAELRQIEQSAPASRTSASPASQGARRPPTAPTQPTARPQHRHR